MDTIDVLYMAYATFVLDIDGMLRRTLYPGVDIYLPYMNAATFFGLLLALSYLAFLANLIKTYGIRTLVGLFIPSVAKQK